MKLIYHPASPYSRKVYILALELGLAESMTLEKVVVAPVYFPGWSDNNQDVSAAGNPLAKIPTLVVDDFSDSGEDAGKPVGIFDSKFICEYLLARAGRDDAQGKTERIRWLEKSIHGACDGITDAEILLVYEERLRKDKGLSYQAWIDGQREKVRRGFDFLETVAEENVLRPHNPEQSVSVAEIATAVTCDMFDSRQYDWRTGRPNLESWYAAWRERPSFKHAPQKLQGDWAPFPSKSGRL
jgi:glutathione S-transferase